MIRRIFFGVALTLALPAHAELLQSSPTTTGGGLGTVTSVTFTGDGAILSSIPSTAVTASGTLNATLANQTANSVLGALTATTPSDIAVPSCSASTSALTWTSGTGFGCHTITPGTGTVTSITAGTGLTGGTITSSGPIALNGFYQFVGASFAMLNSGGL